MKMEKKNYRFKVNKFDVNTGEISGYANTFEFRDYAGDITMQGAFTNSLKRHITEGTVIKMLWQHDSTQVIGVWTSAVEDEHGLYLSGNLIQGVQKADEAGLLLAAGALDGLSIGYTVEDSKYDSKKDARLLLEINLLECSIVTFPCNAQSRIDSVKSSLDEGNVPTERDMEKCLREIGLSQKQAKAFLALGYKGIDAQRDVEDTNGVEDVPEPAEEAPEIPAIDVSLNTVEENETTSTPPSDKTKSVTIEQLKMLSSLF
ncbi:HK97 family phage prohead protease [Aeromonas lacus]